MKKFIQNQLAEFKVLLKSVPASIFTPFVLSVVFMNILANKSVDTGPLTWLALDCGMILSWLAFLTSDILVKRFGPKAATKVSFIAIAINLFVCGVLALVANIPGVWSASYVEGSEAVINTALNETISGTWYILLGSTIAFAVSMIVTNSINWALGKLLQNNKHEKLVFYTRSYVSTGIGQFLDNFIFAILVSHTFFGWSLIQCVTCAITGCLIEVICQIIFSPIGYKVFKKWEEENIGHEYIEKYYKEETLNVV